MTTIQIGDKELKIKYSYKATIKSGIISKLIALSDADDSESVNGMLTLLPELLLAGLQKFHADEFGCDYTDVSKTEQLDKVYELMDDYFDSDDGDIQNLFDSLQGELLENGFLSKMFQQEKVKAKRPKEQK